MSGYEITIERGDLNYSEMEPLYRQHYGEMQARLARDGIVVADYAPRLDQYFQAFSQGWLLNFVVRLGGKPVGYSNIYITNDMHNGEKIAQEDTIYILPEHRNGIGRRLAKAVLAHLEAEGVRRLKISAATDLRSAKLWRRMGFKDTAQLMTYTF